MDENQIDQLKFISKTHRTAMDTRRGYEREIVTGTVTFFVLTAAAAYGGRLILPNTSCAVALVWVGALLLAALSCCYLWGVHGRNHVNKSIAEAAENAIIDACCVQAVKDAAPEASSPSSTKRPGSTFWSKYWAFVWQAMIIFSFAITSAYLVGTATKSSTTPSSEVRPNPAANSDPAQRSRAAPAT